jgi:hypothetical protein
MPPALRRGIVTLAALVIAPITARAADIPLIRVFPPECAQAPVAVDDFVDALRVELAGRQPHCCVVGPGGEGIVDAVRVTLVIEPCEASTQQVDVLVDVTATRRAITRQVALADLPPEARPRALALAVAELLRTAGEPAPPEAAPPAPPAPSGPPQRPLTLTGNVAGEMRIHVSRDTTLWGPRLGVMLSGGPWQLSLDAGVAAGRRQVDLGELSTLLASASLFAGPRFVLGPVITSVGPAGTLGWARIEGQSNMAGVVSGRGSGIVGTAGLRVAAEGPAGGALRLLAYLEGGMTIRRLDADVEGRPEAGVAGAYLLLAAGIRFGPS